MTRYDSTRLRLRTLLKQHHPDYNPHPQALAQTRFLIGLLQIVDRLQQRGYVTLKELLSVQKEITWRDQQEG